MFILLQLSESLNEPLQREMELEKKSVHTLTEEFTFVRPIEVII